MMRKLLGCYLEKVPEKEIQWNKKFDNTGLIPATKRQTVTPLYKGKGRLNNEIVEIDLWIEIERGIEKKVYIQIKGKENEERKEDILRLL